MRTLACRGNFVAYFLRPPKAAPIDDPPQATAAAAAAATGPTQGGGAAVAAAAAAASEAAEEARSSGVVRSLYVTRLLENTYLTGLCSCHAATNIKA
jgi:hypothetical protein